MNIDILAYIGASKISRIAINFIPCILIVAFWILIVYGLIQLIRSLVGARKEQKLIRMELSKLAEEVYLMRKEQKGDDRQNGSVNLQSEKDKKGSDK